MIDAFNILLHLHNLGKFLSKLDGDRFCLNCFCNFQTDGKRRDYIELEMPKKFEIVLIVQTDKNERVPGCIKISTLLYKSLQALLPMTLK